MGPRPRGTVPPLVPVPDMLQVGTARSAGTAVVALFSQLPPPAVSWRCRQVSNATPLQVGVQLFSMKSAPDLVTQSRPWI